MFLECVYGNFLLQVKDKPVRRGVLQIVIVTNNEGLLGDVKIKGRLGSSDREVVNPEGKEMGEKQSYDLWRESFTSSKILLGRVLWNKALERSKP